MLTLKNSVFVSCPYCGNPMAVIKTAVDKANLKQNTRRSAIHCPHCNLSIKDAIAKKLKELYSKI